MKVEKPRTHHSRGGGVNEKGMVVGPESDGLASLSRLTLIPPRGPRRDSLRGRWSGDARVVESLRLPLFSFNSHTAWDPPPLLYWAPIFY